jgi:hypothetical protein
MFTKNFSNQHMPYDHERIESLVFIMSKKYIKYMKGNNFVETKVTKFFIVYY